MQFLKSNLYLTILFIMLLVNSYFIMDLHLKQKKIAVLYENVNNSFKVVKDSMCGDYIEITNIDDIEKRVSDRFDQLSNNLQTINDWIIFFISSILIFFTYFNVRASYVDNKHFSESIENLKKDFSGSISESVKVYDEKIAELQSLKTDIEAMNFRMNYLIGNIEFPEIDKHSLTLVAEIQNLNIFTSRRSYLDDLKVVLEKLQKMTEVDKNIFIQYINKTNFESVIQFLSMEERENYRIYSLQIAGLLSSFKKT